MSTTRPADPAYLADHLKELEQSLIELQLPKLISREAKEGRTFSADVTVALLTRAPSRIVAMFEGAKQMRESVFLVLSHTWLERKGDHLLMHKGAWYDPDQHQVYLDTYNPPRRVTYFCDYFTSLASFGERPEGEALEDGVSCALSLSCKLEPYINDKLFTRAILDHGLVSFPRTLGFLWKSSRKYHVEGSQRLTIVRCTHVVRDQVLKTVKSFAAAGTSRALVLKRGGPSRLKKREVLYFQVVDELDALVDHVVKVLPTLPDGDSLLIEDFLQSMPSQRIVTERLAPMAYARGAGTVARQAQGLYSLQEALDESESEPVFLAPPPSPESQLQFVVRALSCLDNTSTPIVSSIVGSVGSQATPIDMYKGIPLTVPQILRQWGVNDEDEQKRIIKMVKDETTRIHQLIAKAEEDLAQKLLIQQSQARSDVISVDFILALTGSLVTPQAIRVHDHDTLDMFQRLETISKKRGECVRPWINTMISRSQAHAMRGKVVCIVGGGGFASWAKYDMYHEMGVRIVLVDEKDFISVKAHPCVWKFVHVPTLGDHHSDQRNAELVVEALKATPELEDPASVIDGVTTIYDPAVVVAAYVARMLGKHGNNPEDHAIAKDKMVLANRLAAMGPGTGCLTAPSLFIAGSAEVSTVEEVKAALSGETQKLTLPAVLKNTHGMCGTGVKLVRTVEEAMSEFASMNAALKSGIDADSSGLSFDSKMFLMEYLDGTEHDVDIVMFNGELVTAIVTDNGPTRLPYFNESSACMPSQRHEDEVAALVAGAHECARAAGLHSGVYNVEMKYTSRGPRLIEINARLGGFYLTDWALRVHNVHLLRCVLQIACGIRPAIPAVFMPARCTYVGLQLYPSQHGKMCKDLIPPAEVYMKREEYMAQNRFRRLQAQGVCQWICMAGMLKIDGASEWELAFGNVGCEGNNAREAAMKLISLVKALELDTYSHLPVEYYMVGLGCLPLHQANNL